MVVALIQTDVPKEAGVGGAPWLSGLEAASCNSGQRRKEVMLSDLGVSSRHRQRLGDELDVCFKKCVKSVLGPHHSRRIVQRGTSTKVKRQEESGEELTYDLCKTINSSTCFQSRLSREAAVKALIWR